MKTKMSKAVLVALFVLFPSFVFASKSTATTEDQKVFYALGVLLHRQVASFQLAPAELELVKQGLTDANAGKTPIVDMQIYGPMVQEKAELRRKAQSDKIAAAKAQSDKIAAAKAFEENAEKEKGAVKTASGMIFTSLEEGTGKSPGPTSKVKVNYRGFLTDGTEFDSSYKRGKPSDFPLNRVVKCFSEGMQKMKVGGKAKLVCPAKIAYGDQGSGAIPPGATLVFEVELLEIVK
ncbi:MAG: FKBP-type peptidyl-prolyl cis-trans isomerase [Syntrophorhabdaceae bacterium]|nr:FKBP-type peptidyl-prolyl cis-trans isomerase [Syntrophorhabdaceae bacterium]